jgi:hypothetical protein
MKHFIFILAILFIITGCTSTGQQQPNAAQNNANTAAANSNAAAANTDAAATNVARPQTVPYNGIQNVNPNAFNASNDNLKVIDSGPKKSPMPLGARTAPDDSVFSATMNSKGQPMEIRVFNSHPVLAKVEKTFIGKELQYKVFLKNGKVLDAPAEKMGNFAALAPENILEIVGMLPNRPQPDEDSKSAQKPR